MKIYFINPPFRAEYGKFSRESRSPAVTKSGALYYPLWLIYAAVWAEKQGHSVEFLDAPAKPLNEAESLSLIRERAEGCRLFVLDTSTPSIYRDIAFGEALKARYPEAFIALVGTHPTAVPEETLRLGPGIDLIARREYDFTISRLASLIEGSASREEALSGLSGILGISFRDGAGLIHHNPDAPYIEKLDEIPMAAEFIRRRLNYRDYFFPAAEYPEIQIFTGRGCPCHCTFCVYPQTMHGHRYRLRSPENVVSEFSYIAENFPDVREIVLEDDTFTIDRRRVEAICRLLIERGLQKRFRWLCNARVNTLDLDTMKLMKKAGCRLLIPGIESGNQGILDAIKKGTTLSQVERYIEDSRKAGLLVHACYMVGNPGENRETIEETLRLALRLNTDTAQFFPLIPYPGTEVYQLAKKNGWLRASSYEDYCKRDGTHNTVLDLPELSAEEMVNFCDRARRRYYLRPRYILHRLWMGLKDPADLVRSLKAFGKLWRYLLKRGNGKG